MLSGQTIPWLSSL